MEKIKEEKIIPMTYDKMFKSVLTSKEARGYLVDIISGITGIPKKEISKNMVFKNNEQRLIGISEKRKTTDMIVEVASSVINLEMNKEYYEGLIDRNYEYISKIREYIMADKIDYKEMKKVIQINFDNYNIYKPDKRAIIKFEMMDEEKKIKEGVSIESYHVILPNVKEKYYNEDIKDDLIGKLVIIMIEDDEELERIIKENMELRKVGDKIVEISRDEELQGWYDEEEHKRKVRNAIFRTKMEKGWKKLKEAGKKLEVERDELKKKRDELEEKRDELEEKRDELEEKMDELEEKEIEIEEKRKEIDESRKEIDESRKEIDESRKEIDESRKEIDESRKEIDESRKEIDESRKEIDESRKEIDDLKEEIKEEGKIEIILNMISKGMDKKDISRFTELSTDVIVKIIEKSMH